MPTFKPIPSLSPQQQNRFWERVNIDMVDTDACFPWLGPVTPKGYGRVKFYRVGGMFYAHRVAYSLTRGPIPDGLTIDHTCRNRRCCNPEHLEPVTSRVNTLRGEGITAQLARKALCKHGHELSGDAGRRVCRTCQRLRPQRSQVGRIRKDADRNRLRALERGRTLRSSGLCIQCKEPATGSRCERCRVARNARRRQ